MPRARSSFVHGVVGAAIVLSMAAVDVGPALAADTGTGVPATDTSVRYQVRKGDSLSSIARRNGVTVGALAVGEPPHERAPDLRRPVARHPGEPLRPQHRRAVRPDGDPFGSTRRLTARLRAPRGRQPQRGRPEVQGHRRRHRRGERHPQPEPCARRPRAHDPGSGRTGGGRLRRRSTPCAPTTTVDPLVAAVTPVASTTDLYPVDRGHDDRSPPRRPRQCRPPRSPLLRRSRLTSSRGSPRRFSASRTVWR